MKPSMKKVSNLFFLFFLGKFVQFFMSGAEAKGQFISE